VAGQGAAGFIMADRPVYPGSNPKLEDTAEGEDKAFEELRDLLLGEEKQEISALRERIQNPQLRAQDTSAVIAEAIRLRREQGDDRALREALGPSVEGALNESVRRDPSVLADALFPVMGPAIRKSIGESLRSMLQSFNESLEHSLSIRGIKWRIESLRTGRSFAEIVLLHSLVYRVDQVFLIHKKTGLPLLHLVAPSVESQDPDMVSGMLTAIQDFVRDSFNAPQGETLRNLQVGEVQVWLEQGPQAVLAAVVCGHAPESLRLLMKEKLEGVHGKLATALERFEGDASPFEAVREDLAQCLQARYQKEESSKPRPYFWVLAILVIVLLAGWKTLSVIQDGRLKAFAEELRAQPGIVITSAAKEGGRYRIEGLRDPLAVDPASLLKDSRLDPGRVEFQFRPYYSVDDPLIEKRASAILQPPAGVKLSVHDGTLHASGDSPAGWAKKMRELAPLIAGLKDIDESELDDADSLTHRKRTVESSIILFPTGESVITPDQRVNVDAVREAVSALLYRSEALSQTITIEVVGHADSTGPDSTNSKLSGERANRVERALVQAGIAPQLFHPRGAGTSEPVRLETTEGERRFNRSVTFRVYISGDTKQ
jgi:outer membrane protein OmpA-like peptidoglycan-associated protein